MLLRGFLPCFSWQWRGETPMQPDGDGNEPYEHRHLVQRVHDTGERLT
jgi:hypothetical protein